MEFGLYIQSLSTVFPLISALMHYAIAPVVFAPYCVFSPRHIILNALAYCTIKTDPELLVNFFFSNCVTLSGQFNKKLQPPQPSLAASLAPRQPVPLSLSLCVYANEAHYDAL